MFIVMSARLQIPPHGEVSSLLSLNLDLEGCSNYSIVTFLVSSKLLLNFSIIKVTLGRCRRPRVKNVIGSGKS